LAIIHEELLKSKNARCKVVDLSLYAIIVALEFYQHSKMKKTISLYCMIAFLALSNSSVAFALSTTVNDIPPAGTKVIPPNVREMLEKQKEMKGQVRDDIKDVREKIASSTAEMRGEIKDLRVQNASSSEAMKKALKMQIQNRFKEMLSRMEATIVREETIMIKLSGKIAKLQAAGQNTDTANKYMLEAQAHLKEARDSLEALKATIATPTLQGTDTTTSTSTLAKTALINLRKASSDVEKHVREAHKAMNKAVESLRGGPGKNASTTPERPSNQGNTNN
jgi:myosin heavy subunit